MHRLMTGRPDIEIEGRMGFFTCYANSTKGHNWIREHVSLENLCGTSKQFAVEGTREMRDIADGMLRDGLDVRVNGIRYYAQDTEHTA